MGRTGEKSQAPLRGSARKITTGHESVVNILLITHMRKDLAVARCSLQRKPE